MTNQSSSYSLDILSDSQQPTIFCVRRIICIGRNYAEHAKEMGHDPEREPPFFFYKPLTSLFPTFSNLPQIRSWNMPNYSNNVQHEVEIAIAIGSQVTENNLERSIIAAGIALDMTCRDTQKKAKELSQPWATAKGFDYAAPISQLFATHWEALQALGDFTLLKNNQEIQRGNINQMIWPIPDLLKELSQFTQLDAGDLILTGTPAGVGPVNKGDILKAMILSNNCQLEILIS